MLTSVSVDSNGVINSPTAFLRDRDSEFKILHDISKLLEGETSDRGTIQLYTDLTPCISCRGVIEEFCKKFPNVKVEVMHNNGTILTQ